MAVEDNSTGMSIFGGSSPIDSTCPLRDPTSSIQIGDDLIGAYQSRIDAIIDQLGKNVLLEFEPLRTNCINCIFDPISNRSSGRYNGSGPIPFQSGKKCPYCKGDGVLKQSVSKCIKCLIKWNPQDAQHYGINVSDARGIVRLKTFLEFADDMIRCNNAIVDYGTSHIIRLNVKLIRGPIPAGLRDSRYCVSYWSIIDS